VTAPKGVNRTWETEARSFVGGGKSSKGGFSKNSRQKILVGVGELKEGGKNSHEKTGEKNWGRKRGMVKR